MTLSTQKQQERTATAPVAESSIVAFWREVIVENPIYRREVTAVLVPASYSPEKAETLRAKSRASRATWEALSPSQKLWKLGRPFLITFAVSYALIPVAVEFLGQGSEIGWSAMVGLLISVFAATALAASIVGEREKRTWNALLLTRLTAAQLIGGKVAKSLIILLQGQAFVFAIALAFVVRGILPPTATALLLFPLIFVPNALLMTLVGVETSLWSPNLKSAQDKIMWQSLGLSVLTLLAAGAALAAVFQSHFWMLWLVLLLYCGLALLSSVRIWRRMLRELWRAPKDFSG